MRIQVDARLLRGGGIGRYLRELTSRWLTSPDVEAVGFVGRPSELEPWLGEVDGRSVASVRRLDAGPYSPWAQLAWLRGGDGGGRRWDVTFFPHYDVPLVGCPSPAVVTVHDLIHYQAPEGFPAWKRLAGAALLRGAVRRAARVVAVSQATAEALAVFEPSAAAKTTVVHNGVSAAFLPPYPVESGGLEARWGGWRPFFLTVAPAKAHKNLELAVAALAKASLGTGGDGRGARLVLAGVGHAVPPALARLAARLGMAERLVPLPAVGDDELRWLYRNCAAFLWPSKVEGFGLPPLEALGCGAKVLAADTPVSRELLGGMARLLPLDDAAAWGTEMASALEGAGGSAPQPAQGLAAEVASRYSWDAAAAGTLEILRVAAEQGPG